MKMIVTGAGRSGTHWFAECLRRAGVRATHEQAFRWDRDGTDRVWRVEVSAPAAAYLPVPGAEVVHLVRHPLDSTASRMVRGVLADNPPTLERERLKAWVLERCPQIADGRTHLERAVLYWVYWNQMVEPHADYFLRVEEVVPDDVATLAHVVLPGARPAPPVLPPPIDTSNHPSLSWADLGVLVRPEVCRRVAELAERYGYR